MIRYSVSVDSSVLGPACDGYTHEYSEATLLDHEHDPTIFSIDIGNITTLSLLCFFRAFVMKQKM